MEIKSKIRMAKFATSLGLIEEKDWKTPKIISSSYRTTITKKAISNGIKLGKRIIKNHRIGGR